MRLWGVPIVLAGLAMWMGAGVHAQRFGGEETCVLRGRVVNAATGEAVSGALVELYSEGRKVQFSSADGRFEFGDLRPGSYTLSTRKPGYFDDRSLGLDTYGINPTHAVPSEEDAVLKLTPEGIIYGRLEDEKGRALEGVTVQTEKWVVSNGMKSLQPAAGGPVQTDDEGNFRVAELPPGDYFLKFSEQGGGQAFFRNASARARVRRTNQDDEEKQGYGTQYYPGVADSAMATAIHVRPGATVPVHQTLVRLRLYEITGVVRGAPAGSGFGIMLLPAGAWDGQPRGQVQVQVFPSTGEFRIEKVPGGRYVLQANVRDPLAERHNGRPLLAQTIVDVSADVSGLMLLLGQGATIGVRLTEESSQPGEYGHQVRVNLQSRDFPFSQQVVVPSPMNDQRAPRGFENVAAGTYSVDAWPKGWGYVASLRSAGVDLLKEDLKVGAGTSVAPIEVRLRNDGGELMVGAVENGKPVVARVVVYSEEYPRRSWSLVSMPNDNSTLPNLPPGEYKLVAVRGTRELEFRNPVVMEKYLPHATTVTLAPEAKVNVQVEIQDVEPEQ